MRIVKPVNQFSDKTSKYEKEMHELLTPINCTIVLKEALNTQMGCIERAFPCGISIYAFKFGNYEFLINGKLE